MLPQINRIKKKKDFERIFKNSKNLKAPFFIFRIIKNELGINRFGFVVSQKISKNAVIRNRVRRRLAEVIKIEMSKIKKGTDLVLVALPGIERKEFSEIKEVVNNFLVKAKLFSE